MPDPASRNSGSPVRPSRPASSKASRGRLSKLSRSGWISHQHGGWAMVLAPILVGSILGGFTWWQLLLTVTSLLAFQLYDVFSFWIQAVVPRRRATGSPMKLRLERGKKYLPPLLTYGALMVVVLLVLVAKEPRFLWFGLAIIPLTLIALQQMWVGQPRSFLARATMILAASLLVPMTAMLGNRLLDWEQIWSLALVLAAYFIGTIAYVKTMIRERGNPRWLRFSLAYHAALVALAAIGVALGYGSPWLVLVFVVLLLRAWLFPYLSARRSQPLKPVVFGSAEFLFSAMVVATLLLT